MMTEPNAPTPPPKEQAINLTGYVVIGLCLMVLVVPLMRFRETIAWSYGTLSWILDGMDASPRTQRALLDKALTWNPEWAWAYAERGYTYLAEANSCAALAEFQTALEHASPGSSVQSDAQAQLAQVKCVPAYIPPPPPPPPIFNR